MSEMPELLSLPAEILQNIFAQADQETCRSLRLVNRLLGEIGQHNVFETLVIQLTQDYYGYDLEKIVKRPDIAALVTKIYVNTYDPNEPQLWMGKDETSESLGVLLGLLSRLPRLQSVVLRFHPECPEDDSWGEHPQGEDFRQAVMQEALSTFAAMPQLKELGLRDLWNVHDEEPKVVADRNTVLSRLESLRLNVINVNQGMQGSSDYHREAPQKFWPALPSIWLKPALSNLQHLTLYSTMYTGFFPKCDLADLHFPKLRSLALGNHVFAHDSQLSWILSHSSTLSELYLDDCTILFQAAVFAEKLDLYETRQHTILPPSSFAPHPKLPEHSLYAAYSTRWADYFRAFKEELPHLRKFRFGHSPDWWEDDSMPFENEESIEIGFGSESYLVFCDGYLPSEYMERMIWDNPDEKGEALEPSKEDRVALEELCRKVGVMVTLED
ncbi:uncharacterized protein ANIA_02029 [Aspergillus nidulans FGSC A4]|uniref:F-box domain-containing protein n=1 Tax=Emericella nidulans (strain FGSC A4 / ATCC 38163 / CBS 112.46 / NRRL 194 / M139) TaxID=227321 RepID=C8VLF6_EMENI|nr:hypothetical protein [Aspergillus nidulans FGSC A4]CBF86039.1 TPA: conserved hypothetical protein [Aspergillus nidulans FGSC A4]